ncbi:MAG TPA: DegV family protein [Longimicrobiaceae bacterium]|nr:DegV family protein [Longimicrobiaceae bacterium]
MRPIGYLDGPRLCGALVAACDHVQGQRVELNRINVFPVPDGDTGTNLALTAASIADHLRANGNASVGEVARAAAEAGVLGARGNCGMILSHFLLGFSESVGERVRVTVDEFSVALRAAVEHVYAALERPVEGTMVTVMRAVAEEAATLRTTDFRELLARLLTRARAALASTPELLPVLRNAGVVDAGAKGFVHLLEGIVSYLSGDPVVAVPAAPAPETSAPGAPTSGYSVADEHFRYCTEALVRGRGLPDAEAVRSVLRERGDSLVVIRTGELLKVHVHTDEPEAVFEHLRTLGRLAAHKAEDMRAQHAAIESVARSGHLRLVRRPLTVVVDSAADLPEDVVRAHGIVTVPLNLIFGDQTLRDGVDIGPEAFVARLREGARPSTSQPAPAAFLDGFARAAADGETVLAVLLSSTLSGTYSSAEAAARRWRSAEGVGELADVPVHLFDSRGVSLCEGMLALRAAELGELGWAPDAIIPELRRIRSQSGILFTLDTYDRLIASGRVGRGRALLGTILSIKPILGLDAEGRVFPAARVRGARNALPRMIELLEERIPRGARRLRFGVIQIDAEEEAAAAVQAVRARFGDPEVLVSAATPVLATHTGPGTWGIAYQVED